MADKSHREVQAAAWLELAQGARRLAGNLMDGADTDTLLQYSEELKEKAAKLEACCASREPQDKS